MRMLRRGDAQKTYSASNPLPTEIHQFTECQINSVGKTNVFNSMTKTNPDQGLRLYSKSQSTLYVLLGEIARTFVPKSVKCRNKSLTNEYLVIVFIRFLSY